MAMMKRPHRWLMRASVVALATIGVTWLYWTTPVGPHQWFWAHLIAQKLYYIPILLAAAWFSRGGAILATSGASVLYLTHVFRDWQGHPRIEAEHAASVGTFWLMTFVASTLFSRVRAALSEVHAAHQDTLTALASSLELRELYTAGHSARVRSYTLILADRLGIMDSPRLEELGAGALFHDIGKIGIPDAILLKEAPLDAGEWRLMMSHPELGGALVGKVRSLAATKGLIESHHERFDGTGYPRGLRGTEIPLGARLFAVADTFDAMTTTRSYRPALSFEEAFRAIQAGSGKQFDPEVVEAFLAIPFETWSAAAARLGTALRRTPLSNSIPKSGVMTES